MYDLFIDKIEDLGVLEGVRFWRVRCNICSTEYKARAGNVKNRKRTVCSTCSPLLQRKLEGGSRKHPLYATWSLIKRSVDNTKVKNLIKGYYYNGILLCEGWEDFSTFVSWAESSGYAKGLTIDRIDPSGNYIPENCQWDDLST